MTVLKLADGVRKNCKLTKTIILIQLCLFIHYSALAQKNEIIKLWPGIVPGQTAVKHAPELGKDTSKNVKRISNVTDPLLRVHLPSVKSNRAGIIVCPGGGYRILAINLEGDEIAEYFASKGYTVFVLEYRVPDNRDGAFQDLQRAVRKVRSKASEWKLDADKIGVLGFSAGGHLGLLVATDPAKVSYEPVDSADTFSARPDFTLLIYPAYTANGSNKQELNPMIKVTSDIPPTFIFFTADDPQDMPLPLANAFRIQKIPFEFHIYPRGGHGYGLRKGNEAGEAWPHLAEQWLSRTLTAK